MVLKGGQSARVFYADKVSFEVNNIEIK